MRLIRCAVLTFASLRKASPLCRIRKKAGEAISAGPASLPSVLLALCKCFESIEGADEFKVLQDRQKGRRSTR